MQAVAQHDDGWPGRGARERSCGKDALAVLFHKLRRADERRVRAACYITMPLCHAPIALAGPPGALRLVRALLLGLLPKCCL
jgi:hypothetical protein